MSPLQSINELSKYSIEKLINSIDFVFLDVDGVLLFDKKCIPGATDCLAKLRKLGKKIGFVTNNPIYSRSVIKENLKLFDATEDEIITPIEATLAHLKKISFKNDIYVIGSSLLKKRLKEEGYKIFEFKDISPNPIEETIGAFMNMSNKALEICKNVGAVIVENDLNLTIGSLQVAQFILNQLKDVILLIGVRDDFGILENNIKFISSKFYVDGMERWVQQKPVYTAKPGTAIKDVLTEEFNILDDSRALFIGDSVQADIGFGVDSGYQTCLVLTGVTSKSQVEEWKFPEKLKPNYVAEGLGELYEKIKDL